MTFWILLLLGIAALVAAAALFLLFDVMDNGFAFAGAITLTVAGFMLVLLPSINAIERHMNAVSCRSWGQQTGVPTKWASYNWWDYGCLAKTPSGLWVSNNNYNAYLRGGSK